MPESTAPLYTVNQIWGPIEIKEKGSRFISSIYPISSREEALEIIQHKKKEYHDATHVCFALQLKGDTGIDSLARDDGEPSGTAGAPILAEIKNRRVYNVLVTVVRYFGGTKLGTGGLIRTYGLSAKKVLETATLLELVERAEYQSHIPFHLMGKVHHLCSNHDIILSNESYSTEGINLIMSVRVSLVDRVRQELSDISQGKIQLEDKRCQS